VALNKFGHSLANRGKTGDLEKSLTYLEHSLELREKIYANDPSSTIAARDVAVSLDGLGTSYADRSQHGDVEKASTYLRRGLDLRQKLFNNNPDSSGSARDLAVAHYVIAAVEYRKGDNQTALRHVRECYDILAPFISNGVKYDAPMMSMFNKLKEKFANE
jgi:tetratricopeptide (TPR) repeat protein